MGSARRCRHLRMFKWDSGGAIQGGLPAAAVGMWRIRRTHPAEDRRWLTPLLGHGVALTGPGSGQYGPGRRRKRRMPTPQVNNRPGMASNRSTFQTSSCAPDVLGGARLRHPAALRRRGRRRHLPPGHVPARARARAVERAPTCSRRAARPTGATARTRTAASTHQFQVILKPAPADVPGALPRIARAPSASTRGARHPLRRGRLGEPDARRLGPRLGGVVRRHGDHPVHLLPAGRRHRVQAGLRRAHLRARAHRHVPAERREHLRRRVGQARRDATARSSTATRWR